MPHPIHSKLRIATYRSRVALDSSPANSSPAQLVRVMVSARVRIKERVRVRIGVRFRIRARVRLSIGTS